MATCFGVIQEIIILDYHCVQYPVFKCDWVDVHETNEMTFDKLGFTLVNQNR